MTISKFNNRPKIYQNQNLERLAFPLGGIGAGMICVEGAGAFSHVSLKHKPDVTNEPLMFAAIKIIGEDNSARVLEGPIPNWKIFGTKNAGNGGHGKNYGLPRFEKATFQAHFPFADLQFEDSQIPINCGLSAWSPFIPGNADDSSLPMIALEYWFENTTEQAKEIVFSYHQGNLFHINNDEKSVDKIDNGFIVKNAGSKDKPWNKGALAATMIDENDTHVDCAWFRGGWFDSLTMIWNHIQSGDLIANTPIESGKPSPGGSLYKRFLLQPDEKRSIKVMLNWYVPASDQSTADPPELPNDVSCTDCNNMYSPWYASQFKSINDITAYTTGAYDRLKTQTRQFRDCFHAIDLPEEIVDAITANLSILKSPTVLRQADGRLWCWEGCYDNIGCCYGSCTHVWNYAQALPHLFPSLERTLRHTEYTENQNNLGHQTFRASLPIKDVTHHNFHSAADGQLGGIMKMHREWKIKGDNTWLLQYWDQITQSLEYCIRTWDPDEIGALTEPHHNTYDIEFWGPNGMCNSFYIGALKAAALMADALDKPNDRYHDLYHRARKYMEDELYNGEYFIQKIQWQGLRAGNPLKHEAWNNNYSPEAKNILDKEGPKYQYGNGCLSDGVLGAWIAEMCGVGEILNPHQVRSHLLAVHRYNLKHNLKRHANPQRPGYALNDDGGLLLCTWPHGSGLSLPFVYSNEVWTGIEYQVASHLMTMGCVDEGLEIVRILRKRYDGRIRNPFNEYECGHWYARAMASYGLLQGITGIHYDAINKTLHVQPRIPGDFTSFLSHENGYGLVGIKNGKVFVDMHDGQINIDKIEYTPHVSIPV
ncbi:GH116 family glycosyl hydrolase [Poriferisphaera sp. WC338]|uniref:GH116 family glycosyl hydrolase n=1 Tax=Poriferisphaera sp. WC338 TaxID=3425129 RepID=UPI003D81C193